MKISDFHSRIIVQKNLRQLWNFYIYNNTIFYRIINNDVPSKKIKLVNSVQNYDVTLDSKNNVHLICVKKSGELCYFVQTNNSWKKKTFKKPNSKHRIDFVNILNIDKTIHIFYAYRSSTNSEFYKVFHMHTLKRQWKYIYIASVMFLENTKPYLIDYRKNGDIFFLYKSNSKNRSKLYGKIFNHQSYKWSSVIEFYLSKDDMFIKNFLIDSKNNFHFIYGDNNFTEYLNHPFKNLSNISKFNLLNNPTSLRNMENACYEIFEVENTLWISWKKENVLHYIYSKDYGKSWSQKEDFELSDIYSIKYVGENYKDLDIAKPLITFGVDKNNLMYLLGMDIDFLKEEDPEIDILDISILDIDIDESPGSDDETMDEDEVVGENEVVEKEEIDKDKSDDNMISEDNIIYDQKEVEDEDDFHIYINENIEENIYSEKMEEEVEVIESAEEVTTEEEEVLQNKIKNPTKKSLIEKLKDFLTNN